MKLERHWAMPNKNTFQIKPIKAFIGSRLTKGIWVDPFANNNKFATITNDLDPQYNTDYHLDAVEFLRMFETGSIDGVLFDPPYSPRQISESYKALNKSVSITDTQSKYWSTLKMEIGRIVKSGGKVLTFGWNSGGCGKQYGFHLVSILLVAHGGWHHDTICVEEIKHQGEGKGGGIDQSKK